MLEVTGKQVVLEGSELMCCFILDLMQLPQAVSPVSFQ